MTFPFFVTCAESPEYERTQDEPIMVGSLKADLLLMSCLSAQRENWNCSLGAKLAFNRIIGVFLTFCSHSSAPDGCLECREFAGY